MMKRTMLLLAWAMFPAFFLAQTSLQGTVTDQETGEPIIFGTVAVYKNKVLVTGTETDFDGYYCLTELEAGTYDVLFSYTGYQDLKVIGVVVESGKMNRLNGKLTPGPLPVCFFFPHDDHWHRPIITKDGLVQGFSFSAKEISRISH